MIRRALLWCAIALPLALGVLAGLIVRVCLFVWAALITGYVLGRGL